MARPRPDDTCEVAGRDVRDVERPDCSRTTSASRPAPASTSLGGGVRGEPIAGEAPEPAVALDEVGGADLGVEVFGEEAEHALAQRLEPLLALQAGAQLGLSAAQPDLRLAGPVIAGQQERGHGDQQHEQRRSAPRDLVGDRDRLLPFGLANALFAPLVRLHRGDDGADPLHRRLPFVGADDGQRAGGVAGTDERDGAVELGDLLRRVRGERVEPVGLRWTRPAASAQRLRAPPAGRPWRRRTARGSAPRR